MTGLDINTGRAVNGDAYLAQLIGKAFSTPVGSRPFRRGLGSILPELIDQPYNPALRQRLFAAAAAAIRDWLPFLALRSMTLERDAASGAFSLTATVIRPTGAGTSRYASLTVPLRSQGATALIPAA
jgi:phage baseplate assembly protein W